MLGIKRPITSCDPQISPRPNLKRSRTENEWQTYSEISPLTKKEHEDVEFKDFCKKVFISDSWSTIIKEWIIKEAIRFGAKDQLNTIIQEIESSGYVANLSNLDLTDSDSEGINFRNSYLQGTQFSASTTEISDEITQRISTPKDIYALFGNIRILKIPAANHLKSVALIRWRESPNDLGRSILFFLHCAKKAQ